jgi:hypothetical protein
MTGSLSFMAPGALRNLAKRFLAQLPDEAIKTLVLALTFEVKRRVTLSFSGAFGNNVVDGPFRGTLMLPSTHGGSNQEVFGQSIGTYEAPVTQVLTSRKWLTFLDIGAESGFYVAGMLKNGWAKHAYAFESNEASQLEMSKRLELNGVSATLLGHADFDRVSGLLETKKLNSSDTVVLCDIEGGEFELFSEALLHRMDRCTIIVELHDPQKRSTPELIQRFSKTHQVEVANRDTWRAPFLSDPSLDQLSDHQKMLLISEGREFPQSWLVAKPT